MSERIILKLGGSVITGKNRDCTINHAVIRDIAREIGRCGDRPLLLVHGAGSCGHPEAHRYGLQGGVNRENSTGIAITHHAVMRLNDAIVTALREEGLDALGIHPLDGCLAQNGRITGYEHRHIALMLELGIIPVLHGDVVMDQGRGASIVSGDQLVRYFGTVLAPDRIGLATDVPGVLADGQVLPLITPALAPGIEVGGSGHTDVTGGMRGKLDELLSLATLGIRSEIFHVSRLADFLGGRATGGTVVSGGVPDAG
jgi:isopentenyl phosphate kinase